MSGCLVVPINAVKWNFTVIQQTETLSWALITWCTVITVSVKCNAIFRESVLVMGSSSSRVVLTTMNTGAQKAGSSMPWLLSFCTIMSNKVIFVYYTSRLTQLHYLIY